MFASLVSRESGDVSDRNFRLSTSSTDSGLVHRLCKQKELTGHSGCVNTVTFSPDGEQLLLDLMI